MLIKNRNYIPCAHPHPKRENENSRLCLQGPIRSLSYDKILEYKT